MTFLLEIVRLGLGNLLLHKLRSVLTSLGIILGVAAVIIMVSIGEGNKQAALRSISALGATNIILRSERPPESASFGSEGRSFVASFGLLREDLRRLEAFVPDAEHIAPLKQVGDEMSYREKRMVSQAFGATPEMIEVANLRIARGRYLTQQDLDQRASVAVIGERVAKQFFPLEDPLGKEFRISDRVFRVIGVFEPVGLAGGSGSALVGRDLNGDVHIPMSTAELEFGDVVYRRSSGSFSGEQVEVYEIFVTAATTEAVIDMASRVRRTIEVAHPELNDVQVIVPWELLEQLEQTQRIWNIVLTAIAAISLLVGGIGIMNIMLASVTERTREIGIRRALGATRKHVTLQFLVETGSLACLGGLVGIGLGVGVSVFIDSALPALLKAVRPDLAMRIADNLNAEVTMWSIVASFLVAAFVGLVFGIYPAIQASRQDPIVALRHD